MFQTVGPVGPLIFIMASMTKYCAVNSCVNFHGTNDTKVHMFRIPKNRDIAEKWLSFLGVEANPHGYVCNKHIKDEYMNKNKNRLLSKAAPAMFSEEVGKNNQISSPLSTTIATIGTKSDQNVEKDVIDITESFASLASLSPAFLEPSTPSTSSTIVGANPCEQCMKKDDRIDSLEAEIRLLKHKLQCANKKVSYLKKVRNKLEIAFSDMKKQNIINEDQCKLLEVIDNFLYIII